MDWTECELRRAREYMHAEDETDETVAEFLDMAAEYLAETGITPVPGKRARYDIVLRSIALHYYDNRNAKADVDFSLSLRRAINQLKPPY